MGRESQRRRDRRKREKARKKPPPEPTGITKTQTAKRADPAPHAFYVRALPDPASLNEP